LIVITGFQRTLKFQRDWKKCPVDIRRSAGEAFRKLLGNPSANGLRLHPLKALGKPTVYKVDVLANHSWQISLHLEGGMAILRRLGTHQEIDRGP
jgi:hypothetical protein